MIAPATISASRALAALAVVAVVSGCAGGVVEEAAAPAGPIGTVDETPTDGQPLLAIEREFVEARYGVDVRCRVATTLAPELASAPGAQAFGFPPEAAADVAAFIDPRRAIYAETAVAAVSAALRRGGLLGRDATMVTADIAAADAQYRDALSTIAASEPAVTAQAFTDFLGQCERRYRAEGEGGEGLEATAGAPADQTAQ